MSMKTKIALIAAPVALGFATLAMAAQDAPETQRQSPEDIWDASCGYCHGGPMNAPQLRGRQLPSQLVITIARHGANGMPPFHESELDDKELAALARWISESPAPDAESSQ